MVPQMVTLTLPGGGRCRAYVVRCGDFLLLRLADVKGCHSAYCTHGAEWAVNVMNRV